MVEISSHSPKKFDVRIEVLPDTFEFLLYIPGENLPRKFLGVDNLLRVLRYHLQSLRYGDAIEDEIESEKIAARA